MIFFRSRHRITHVSTVIFSTVFLAKSVLLPATAHADFNHTDWDMLLQAHVRVIEEGRITQVDYAGMSKESDLLDNYLDNAASVNRLTFDNWPPDEQLAFLINVYNAATVALVLTEYPELDSIRDLGSFLRSPWNRPIVSLFGGNVSLDNIEHDMIRGWNIYNEPRIHFAVNCAAIGCPPLRAEAYVGVRLSEQLDDNVRLFLADRDRNYLEGKRLYVSKIFDWYSEDFNRGWQGIDSLAEFLVLYSDALDLTIEQQAALQRGEIAIRFLSYDWNLNQLQ